MGEKVLSNKVLYYYTTLETVNKICEEGFIFPSKPRTYLSVNEKGDFDYVCSEIRDGRVLTDGRSDIPNVFLTDMLPDNPRLLSLGIGRTLECVFSINTEEIIKQGLNVYKNPSTYHPNFYNVPISSGKGLGINSENYFMLKSPIFVPSCF